MSAQHTHHDDTQKNCEGSDTVVEYSTFITHERSYVWEYRWHHRTRWKRDLPLLLLLSRRAPAKTVLRETRHGVHGHSMGRERVRDSEENKRAHALADFDDLLLFGRWRGSKRRQIRAHNASRRALGGPHCRPRMDASLAHAHKQSAAWPTRRQDTVWVRVCARLDW